MREPTLKLGAIKVELGGCSGFPQVVGPANKISQNNHGNYNRFLIIYYGVDKWSLAWDHSWYQTTTILWSHQNERSSRCLPASSKKKLSLLRRWSTAKIWDRLYLWRHLTSIDHWHRPAISKIIMKVEFSLNHVLVIKSYSRLLKYLFQKAFQSKM